MKIIKIILITVILVPVVLLIALYANHRYINYKINKDIQKGLTFLDENRLQVQLLYNDNLYNINKQKELIKLNFKIYSRHKYEATVEGSEIWYSNYTGTGHEIKLMDTNNNILKNIKVEKLHSPMAFAVSPDGKYLAFSCYLDANHHIKAIAIYDLTQNNFEVVCRHSNDFAAPICWSVDGKSIFYASAGQINHFFIEEKQIIKIADGYGVFSFNDSSIGFYNYDDDFTIFYKIDMVSKNKIEIFKTDKYVEGIAWDQTGNYIALAIPTYSDKFLSFRPGISPRVYDIKNKKLYRLPYCEGFTGNISINYLD